MDSFIATDDAGNFTINGEPWFFHGATYFGRRPGTCGADWMTEHFEHNLQFMDRDFARMRELGLTAMGLFVPGRSFWDGLEPKQEMFDRLHTVLDKAGEAGIRTALFGARGMPREAWCEAHGVDPEAESWHPAVNPDGLDYTVDAASRFISHFADRPEVIGYLVGVGRLFRYKFTVPPVRGAWAEWLEDRFEGDFGRAAELLDLEADEQDWADVRMPVEMEPYFNEDNPRSFEFALMQQVLCRRATAQLIDRLREVAPNQLLMEAMEGCCFSTGHLTTMVPEMVTGDALWIECYHWEGLRSYHLLDEEELRWMRELVAGKPSVDIINAAGYVQMLTRWMERSGRPMIICHGVDIGDEQRGVRSEEDQLLMLDRYNTFFQSSGGHAINYWCWSDDELSKTFTRLSGIEYGSDSPEDQKPYPQAGETMGVVRYDGSERPVAARIRARSRSSRGKPRVERPDEALVLFPSPMFQSLHRYRSNLTGFAILTSLARIGIFADVAFTSAGEEIVTVEQLEAYKAVIVGAPEYTRDHSEVPAVLLDYVRRGGTILFAVGDPDELEDPYLETRQVQELRALAGCAEVGGRKACEMLDDIRSEHVSFPAQTTPSWELDMDEEASLTRLVPAGDAEVLVTTGDAPLLYRHRIGDGAAYVFTWNLDVLLYKGSEIDYKGGQWDWLWQGLADEVGLSQDVRDPMAATVREMTFAGRGE